MRKTSFSTIEAAKILGVSRIAVFKKIKSGALKAKRVGRNFVIEKRELSQALGEVLTPQRKREVELAVARTIREYGEALTLLGKE